MKRRTAILGSLAVGVGLAGLNRNSLARWILTNRQHDDLDVSAAPDIDSDRCILTAQQAEGPYHVNSPVRSNITEGRNGVPFELNIQVTDENLGCTPIENAVVEIWHCDSRGVYSAFPDDMSREAFDINWAVLVDGERGKAAPVNDKTYLRGAQATDENGMVSFSTIFPGWYETRVTHIHMKVYTDEKNYLTTQLYFPDDLCERIYTTHSDYAPHGPNPYKHHNDLILGFYPQSPGVLIVPEETGSGLVANVKIGVVT